MPISIAFEQGLLFCDERMIGAREVLRLHADRLSLCFGFEGLIQAHVPLLVQLRLGDSVREGRPFDDAARQIDRFALQCIRIDQPVVVPQRSPSSALIVRPVYSSSAARPDR